MIPSRQYKLEEETKMAAKKDTSAAVPAGSDKKKALDITAIKTEELTIVSDYFVIATGTSNTHVKSLSNACNLDLGELFTCHRVFVINIAIVVNYITVDSAVCIKAEVEVICTADNI